MAGVIAMQHGTGGRRGRERAAAGEFEATSEVRREVEIDGAVECLRAAMRQALEEGAAAVLVRVRSLRSETRQAA